MAVTHICPTCKIEEMQEIGITKRHQSPIYWCRGCGTWAQRSTYIEPGQELEDASLAVANVPETTQLLLASRDLKRRVDKELSRGNYGIAAICRDHSSRELLKAVGRFE